MARIPNPFNQYFDNDGKILAGGQVWYYEPGSTTVLKDTYSDSGLTTANTNPVILGQDGRLPDVFGDGSYRIELRAAAVFPNTVGRLIDEKDIVDATGTEQGPFTDWLSTEEYSIGDIRKGSDGNYYISLTNNNLNNDPTTSSSDWGLYPGRTGNLLYNAQGRINQRAVSGSVVLGAGIYGHDRWRAGTGGVTYSFSESAQITTFNISAGTLEQVIPGNDTYTGTVYLSWDGTAQAQINGGGFGDSPITASVTGGASVTVEFGTGTFSKPQLETGPTQTEFEYISLNEDETKCKYFFERIFSSSSSITLATVYFDTTTSFRGAIGSCLPKRNIPTVTYSALGDFDVIDLTTPQALNTLTINYSSQGLGRVVGTFTGPATAGRGGTLRANGTGAPAYIDIDSEI